MFVHITNPGVCWSLSCLTRCIRFACAISGATQNDLDPPNRGKLRDACVCGTQETGGKPLA